MGFLKHFRSRARLRSQQELQDYPLPKGSDRTLDLPHSVLARIFTFVCPSVADETYEVNERSLGGNGCSVCDIRDLAQCAKTCHRWYSCSTALLYHSVRIDAVHFCGAEEHLSDQRKKKKIDPSEIPIERLRLFQKTVWRNSKLAEAVLFLKLPYMTRESYKGDLARTVSALSNLRYVDLPEGFFSADSSCQILRDELQSRCPNVGRMAFHRGSEQAFELLAQSHVWPKLQVITLKGVDVDVSILRVVLSAMEHLQEVRLQDMPRLDDMLFQSAATLNLPSFPSVLKLHISNAPGISADGLIEWLTSTSASIELLSLSLINTGVVVPALCYLASHASALQCLSLKCYPDKGMPMDPLPGITSTSLTVLSFDIRSNDSTSGSIYTHAYSATPLTKPTDSYYTYLASSIQANGLPSLRKLYVRDPDFPQRLASIPRSASSQPHPSTDLHHSFEIYSRGDDDLDWIIEEPLRRPSTAERAAKLSAAMMAMQLPSGTPVSNASIPPNAAQHNASQKSISGRSLEPSHASPTSQHLIPNQSLAPHRAPLHGTAGTTAPPTFVISPSSPGPNATSFPPSDFVHSYGTSTSPLENVRHSYISHAHSRSGSGMGTFPGAVQNGASNRPVSSYNPHFMAGSATAGGAMAGGAGFPLGGSEARKSVMMGDGKGGFTELPQPPVMPAALDDYGRRPGSAGSVGPRGGSPVRPGSRGSDGEGFFKRHFRNGSDRRDRDLWR